MFNEGTRSIRVAGGPVSFYDRYVTTVLYVERVFGGEVNTITVSNDSSTDTVCLSFDGASLEGELGQGESVTLNTSTKSSVFVRGTVGNSDVRIWGW